MSQLYQVSFKYPEALNEIFTELNLGFEVGWTGIIGENGAGKSTLLDLVVGNITPHRGSVQRPPFCILCEQRTDDPPPELMQLLTIPDNSAARITAQLHLKCDWLERWHTLSFGERKRAQLAVALWQQPDLMAVDEPTNHLDIQARTFILEALQHYSGTGLIVSHDRNLLDILCQRTVMLQGGQAHLYTGGYTQATKQQQLEQCSRQHEAQQLQDRLKQLQSEHRERQQEASQQNKKRSKRHLSLRDTDARQKLDMARVSGADGHAGRKAAQMEGRITQIEQQLQSLSVGKNKIASMKLHTQRSRRQILLHLPTGTIHSGSFHLQHPELVIRPSDRISLTGANGTGKSTLIKSIVSMLEQTQIQMLYIPQEISLQQANALQKELQELPDSFRGRLLGLVSALGSDAKALLHSTNWSPGELRKILLALGLMHTPELIIMDEPTNHLDLPSVEALETALQDSQSALLLASHDQHLLKTICNAEWAINMERRLQIL